MNNSMQPCIITIIINILCLHNTSVDLLGSLWPPYIQCHEMQTLPLPKHSLTNTLCKLCVEGETSQEYPSLGLKGKSRESFMSALDTVV